MKNTKMIYIYLKI